MTKELRNPIKYCCPKCVEPLVYRVESLYCSGCDIGYGEIDGKPVLMLADSANTFGLTPDANQTKAVEGSETRVLGASGKVASLKRLLKRIVSGENRVAIGAANSIRADREGTSLRVLVVGGGTTRAAMQTLKKSSEIEVVSFDVYRSQEIDFLADAHRIPLPTASVDAVWVQAVLEHVHEPWIVAQEIERVCKVGGLIYAETPYLQSVHEGAYDFFRFGAAGARVLFRNTTDEAVGVVAGAGVALQWSLRDAVRTATGSSKLGTLAYTAFFWLRWIGSGHSQNELDRASCVGVLLRRSNTRRTNLEIIEQYGDH